MPEIEVEQTWRARIEQLAGARKEIWIAAAIVLIASAFSIGTAVGRERAPRIAPPATTTETSQSAPSPSPTAVVVVHVAGAVRHPGLYTLADGTRVADAVDAAGGATRRADLDSLNLAQLLIDGQKIEVLAGGVASAAPAPATSSGAASPSAMVGLNSADEAALETIPGVGPVTAAAIIAYREQAGGFASIDELLDVDGIGPATLEEIRPYVSL